MEATHLESMSLLVKLQTEQLEEQELAQLIEAFSEDKAVLVKVLSQKNLTKELKEEVLQALFTKEITAQIKTSNGNIVKAWNEKGLELEYLELITYELNEKEQEQVKALASLEEELVTLKITRIDEKFSAQLMLPELEVQEEIVKKSKTRVMFEKAVMMSVLFAVVSGIGSKAYGQTVDTKSKTTINYNLDTDLDNSKAIKQLKQLQGTVDFLTKHMELSKEVALYEQISHLLQENIDEASDLNKPQVKAKVAQLDKESKLDLELKIGDLKDLLGRKLSTQSYIKDNLQAFDTQIHNLESQNLDEETKVQLEELKNNPNVPALKKIMATNSDTLTKNLQSAQGIYSHILETPAGPGLKHDSVKTFITKK